MNPLAATGHDHLPILRDLLFFSSDWSDGNKADFHVEENLASGDGDSVRMLSGSSPPLITDMLPASPEPEEIMLDGKAAKKPFSSRNYGSRAPMHERQFRITWHGNSAHDDVDDAWRSGQAAAVPGDAYGIEQAVAAMSAISLGERAEELAMYGISTEDAMHSIYEEIEMQNRSRLDRTRNGTMRGEESVFFGPEPQETDEAKPFERHYNEKLKSYREVLAERDQAAARPSGSSGLSEQIYLHDSQPHAREVQRLREQLLDMGAPVESLLRWSSHTYGDLITRPRIQRSRSLDPVKE